MNLEQLEKLISINGESVFYILMTLVFFMLFLIMKIDEFMNDKSMNKNKKIRAKIYIISLLISAAVLVYVVLLLRSNNFAYNQCKIVSIEKEFCYFNFYYDNEQEKYTLILGKLYYGYNPTFVDTNGNILNRREDSYIYKIKVGEFKDKKSIFFNLNSWKEIVEYSFNKIWNKENQEKVKKLIEIKDKEFANLMDNNHVD